MKKCIIVIAIIAIAGTASADLLMGWDLDFITIADGPKDDVTCTSNTVGISTANTLSAGAGANVVGRNHAVTLRDMISTTNIAQALSNDVYWGTTVAKSGTMPFTLSTFVARPYRSSGDGVTFDLRSSVDNYTTSLGTIVDPDSLSEAWSVDLTSLSGSHDSVEFRVYIYDITPGTGGAYDGAGFGNVGSATDALIDFGIEGDVIPEPALLGLLGLGILALVRKNR